MRYPKTKYPGIRQRGEESFEIKYSANGVPVYETVHGSIEDANLKRAMRIAAARSNKDNILIMPDITFEQAFNSYRDLKLKILKDNTIQRSECIYHHFVDYIKVTYPNIRCPIHVTAEIGVDYKNFMLSKTGKTPSGINTDITKLRAIFRVFYENHFIEGNPFLEVSKIPKREAKPKEKHLPIDSEIRILLNEFSNDASYAELTKFMFKIGRRIEEMALYQKNDIIPSSDGEPHALKIRKEITKTGYSGIIEFDRELKEIISVALKKHPKTLYLFTNEWGRKVAQNTYREVLKRVCKRNKIPYSSPHCFRYYVVNKLMNAGMNLRDAMSITGHIDINSFMSYLKSTPEGRMKCLAITSLKNLG